MQNHPYSTLLEDIDWLWKEWWAGQPDELTTGHLRRGSATLSLLLVDGLLSKAWRYYGFERQPRIWGPHIRTFVEYEGYRLDLAPGIIAGGGRQNGLDLCFIGAFCVDNSKTGVPADADEGFAVKVTCVSRKATDNPTPGPLDSITDHEYYVTNYLDSASAFSFGKEIKRRDVIQYFRNYAGGAHHYQIGKTKDAKRVKFNIVGELQRRVRADYRDGLFFELLSIGQAVARSKDVQELADRVRADMD